MSRRLRFKHCYRCVVLPSDGVFLLSENGHSLLQGEAYVKLAPLLDGRYTEDEIIDLLDDQLPAAQAYYALELLRTKGYIVDARTSMSDEQASFWSLLGVDSETAEKRLNEAVISIHSFGSIDTTPFNAMLSSIGIAISDAAETSVVFTDDYLHPSLDAFNKDALHHNRSWLLCKPSGLDLWIGPLFVPGRTGCWECLAHRLRGHRKVESYLQEKTGVADPFSTPLSMLPTTLQIALGLAATEVARWIVCGVNEHLEGKVLTLNLRSLERNEHLLVQRPQCRRCGSPNALSGSIPPRLQSQPKSFTSDGGHRNASPEMTLKKLEHHISGITGIINVLSRSTPLMNESDLVPSYVTDHNFIHMNDDLYFLRSSLRGRSGGKGKRDVQAKVSALCESIERYSGVFQGDEKRISARFAELGSAAIHPNAHMLFSECQFEDRVRWNSSGSRFNRVPERFDEKQLIEWSPVWSLKNDAPRYLPTACCYYGYARMHNALFADADSNGCAAGNSKEEAILQGFMELVERDSIAIWWYNRLRRPGVDLTSFDDPYIEKLCTYYNTVLHRELWVLDLTSDLAIPTFAALSRRNDSDVEDIIFGFGAHFDPQTALVRALTELNQSLPAVLPAVKEKGRYLYPDGEAVAWWKNATVVNQLYLSPDPMLRLNVQSDYPKFWSDDLYTDVMTCAQVAEQHGLEMLVLDQTRPDTGLDVVKVIVPGLRHFWARFAPGRLYDVPVQMSWLERPSAEDELNPTPMFF